MTQINAYLTFTGNCREVMSFYKDCLGGDLKLETVGGSPMAGQFPEGMKDLILHSSLIKDGLSLFGSDMAGPEGVIKGNAVTLSLNCDTLQEVQTSFSALSEGGKIKHPLEDFFAGTMGNLTDKFGTNWMFYTDKKAKG